MITFVLIVLQEMILLCDDTTTKMFLKFSNNVATLYENVLSSYISILCMYILAKYSYQSECLGFGRRTTGFLKLLLSEM